MKKKLLVVILAAIAILLLAGCGEKPASEATLKEDIYNSSNFSRFSEQLDMEITNLEIVKRQTSTEDKVDSVWVKVTAAGDTAEGEMYYVMTYNLYNDGWLLETITDDALDSWHFEPLCAPSDEEISNRLSYYGDYNILNESLDIENGLKEVDFEYTENHLYCRKNYTAQLICEFVSNYYEFETGDIGEWIYAILLTDEETVWDVCGTYYRESNGSEYQITGFRVEDLSTEMANLTDYTDTDRFFGHWVDNGYSHDSPIIPAKLFTSETTMAVAIMTGYDRQYVSRYRYTAVFDNLNWLELSFITSDFLIGPDDIYWISDTYRTDGDHTVHLTTVKMIRG